MRVVNNIEEYSAESLEGVNFDLVIASSGFESRATYLACTRSIKSDYKFSVGFDNYRDLPTRNANDIKFKQLGYELILASGNTENAIVNLLGKFEFKNNVINILIDYSCMTRVWYASILKFFKKYSNEKINTVNLFFSYSVAKYLPPPIEIVPNQYVNPIDNSFKISNPQKPTALVIGLGNENIRAFGLKELFDAETYVFYTDNSKNNRFSFDVEECNRELLDIISEENIFKYPLEHLSYLNFVLHFLCKKLEQRFKIIIAPCGPKPFTLIALLNSLMLTDTSVWRISPGEKASPVDREACGDILIAKVQFVSDL